jgi:predicted AAA+ superfamily ATPase
MYVPRELGKTFHRCIAQFPAVLVTGPRQSGKTTFLQNELKGIDFVTFDDPLNRDFALKDTNGFLDRFDDKPVILDEIQYVPEILQYIKIRIDRKKAPGIWIMSGSQQFHLMKNVSETLAGRIAILELAPFCVREAGALNKTLEDVAWTGLFPEPSCYPEKRDIWLKSYVQTYLERDVRQIENIRDFRSFEMFVNLSAAFHSQEFHPASLAGDCGVSQPTIKSWSKTLEASYLAIMLPPFFKNFGKRVVKTSKFYFGDPSLVCFLTRQPSAEAALRGNMGGALFEGLIIAEAWKVFLNLGQRPSTFFWRSHGGIEVDLIIQAQNILWPVEIKLTSTPSVQHTKGIDRFKKLAGKEASERGIIVCSVKEKLDLPGNNIALPWTNFYEWLESVIR